MIEGRLLGKLALTRGRVPLSVIRVGINESRFATRAWACGERVRCPTILSKIVDKIPDDRGGNRGKPGVG